MHSSKFHVTFTECQTVDLNIERCNHHARKEECLARIQFILDLTIYHLCDNLGSWFINCEIWSMIKKEKGKKIEKLKNNMLNDSDLKIKRGRVACKMHGHKLPIHFCAPKSLNISSYTNIHFYENHQFNHLPRLWNLRIWWFGGESIPAQSVWKMAFLLYTMCHTHYQSIPFTFQFNINPTSINFLIEWW